MPDARDIVINTGPLIALVAALGDLRVLRIYRQAWVPDEVGQRNEVHSARFERAVRRGLPWPSSRQPIGCKGASGP